MTNYSNIFCALALAALCVSLPFAHASTGDDWQNATESGISEASGAIATAVGDAASDVPGAGPVLGPLAQGITGLVGGVTALVGGAVAGAAGGVTGLFCDPCNKIVDNTANIAGPVSSVVGVAAVGLAAAVVDSEGGVVCCPIDAVKDVFEVFQDSAGYGATPQPTPDPGPDSDPGPGGNGSSPTATPTPPPPPGPIALCVSNDTLTAPANPPSGEQCFMQTQCRCIGGENGQGYAGPCTNLDTCTCQCPAGMTPAPGSEYGGPGDTNPPQDPGPGTGSGGECTDLSCVGTTGSNAYLCFESGGPKTGLDYQENPSCSYFSACYGQDGTPGTCDSDCTCWVNGKGYNIYNGGSTNDPLFNTDNPLSLAVSCNDPYQGCLCVEEYMGQVFPYPSHCDPDTGLCNCA